jgi:hypothetical protein
MATREYGVDNGNGTVTVYQTDDNGNTKAVRTETMAQNQAGATPTAAATAPGNADPSKGFTAGTNPANTVQTRNGPKTIQQIADEMHTAGYNGPWDDSSLVAAYNNVPTSGEGPGGPGGAGAPDTGIGFNLGAGQLAFQMADAKTKNDLAKAAQDWMIQNQQAILTGTFQGNPTMAMQQYLHQVANDAFNQNLQQAQLAISKGQLDLSVGTAQGYVNGAPTVAEQQTQNQATQAYLTLLSNLKGPENAFQYARTLAGTPKGFQDIVASATGQRYNPGFGGTSGEQPVAASLGGLLNDASGGQVGQPGSNAIPNYYGPGAARPTPQIPPSGDTLYDTSTAAYQRDKAAGTPWNQAEYERVMGGQGVPTSVADQMWQSALSAGVPTKGADYNQRLNAAYSQYNAGQTAQPTAPTYPTSTPGQSIQPATAPTTTGDTHIHVYPNYTGPANGGQQGGNPPMATTDGAQNGANPPTIGPYTGPGTTATQMPDLSGLVPGSKINNVNYQRMDPSQQKLLQSAYGYAGWNWDDVANELKNSLPAYGGPRQGLIGT